MYDVPFRNTVAKSIGSPSVDSTLPEIIPGFPAANVEIAIVRRVIILKKYFFRDVIPFFIVLAVQRSEVYARQKIPVNEYCICILLIYNDISATVKYIKVANYML